MVRIAASAFLSLLLFATSRPMMAQRPSANANGASRSHQEQTVTFRAYVPFPFMVGGQSLPAGAYQIQRLLGRPGQSDEIGMIVLRCADRGIYKSVLTRLTPRADDSRSYQLVFSRRDGQRYLSQVLIGGEKGHQIPVAINDSEVARSAGSGDEVIVADLR